MATSHKQPYPVDWPTGKPSRETRRSKRKWRRKKARLTALDSIRQNARVVWCAHQTGRRNPIQSIGAQAPTTGRYFFARCFTMAAWAGQVHAWPGSYCPVFHPHPSRHPSAVESGRVGSTYPNRSHPMNTPSQATPKNRPNFRAKPPATSADWVRPWADKSTETLLRGE